jgi:hypothetical protein
MWIEIALAVVMLPVLYIFESKEEHHGNKKEFVDDTL